MADSQRTSNSLIAVSVVLAALIFTLDLSLPLGVAGGVPYLLVILLGLWSPNKKFIIISAVGCSILTLLGFYLSPVGDELWKVVVNRILGFFVIWAAAVLCIIDKNHKVNLFELNRFLEERESTVLDYVIDGIITIDEKGTVESFNPAAERLFGYPPSEVIGKNIKMLMPEPYRSEHDQYLKNYRDSGISKVIGIGSEVVGLRKNGTTFPLDLGISEMILGETRMFTGIVRDITERKEAEQAIKESKTRIQAILDNAVDGMITIDEQGIIESFNPAAECLFGYKPSEVLGLNVKMLIPEPYRSEHDQYMKNYLVSGVKKIIGIGREVVGLRKDGTIFDMDLRVSEMYLGTTRKFTGFAHDITSRKAAEKQLEQITRKNQQILDSAGEGIYGVDLEGNTTFVNPAAEEMLGYKEKELLGKLQHALIHHTKFDGTPYPREECLIYAAINDGKVHRESEEVFWRKDGTSFPVEYISTPIKENGIVVGAVVIFSDITDRKIAQKMIEDYTDDFKRANDNLFRSNKELDDFAYIVSHDLKEPLRGIYNYSEFIKEDYFEKLDEDGKSKLDTLIRLSQRMELLINNVLQYARFGRSDMNLKPTDLNKTLKEVLDNLQFLRTESRVDIRIPEPLPVVTCDEVWMREVFQNLIVNAMKYNDKEDKWVEVGCLSEASSKNGSSPSQNTSMSNGAAPVFYVRDNGIGIPEKYHDSLFRIFKRLNGKKKFGEGAGAGTTIAKKVIERHNGKIWVESTEGEGTTFYFTLGGEHDHEQHQVKSLDFVG